LHVRKVPGAGSLARKQIYPYELKHMQSFGETCSMTERRADAASYDVVDWLKCEYIQDRVGEEFNGTISSVTAFGLFVELSDIYVEGLVHITALKNDYYQFDPVRHLLRGERSGVTYHLGGVVRVKVVRVDLDDRKIDLGMADGLPAGGNPGLPVDGAPVPRKRAAKASASEGRKGKSKPRSKGVKAGSSEMSLREKLAAGLVKAPGKDKSAPLEVKVAGRRKRKAG
jgi:ribonuclease R